MEKKRILVAFDDSENAMRAVQFVAETFTPDHEISLLSVIPDTVAICDYYSPELTPYFYTQRDLFCSLEDKKRELVDAAAAKAKEILMRAGFPGESIQIKVETKKKGIARDIVDEAESGYNLVVLGRRGLSGLKEFFIGSISQKVLNAAKDVSVLIVN